MATDRLASVPRRVVAHVSDLLNLVTDYRAGLEAEIALLRHLAALALREREVAEAERIDTLDDITDARDHVMAALVALESQLKPVRRSLRESRDAVVQLQEFKELSALHEEAAALAEEILSTDAQSLTSLREAELARRFAAESIEKGETTLAAYRRVVMPTLASATLVNRRG